MAEDEKLPVDIVRRVIADYIASYINTVIESQGMNAKSGEQVWAGISALSKIVCEEYKDIVIEQHSRITEEIQRTLGINLN